MKLLPLRRIPYAQLHFFSIDFEDIKMLLKIKDDAREVSHVLIPLLRKNYASTLTHILTFLDYVPIQPEEINSYMKVVAGKDCCSWFHWLHDEVKQC